VIALSCRLTEDEKELLNAYHKMLRIIPSLKAQVKYAVEHRASGLVDLAIYVRSLDMYLISHSSIVKIEATGNKGRSDDCGTLRNAALDYVPRIKDLHNIDRTVKKEQRGFSHYMTARLLCPRQLRDKFDADMEGFCRSMQSGSFIITHDDWPSFLYPEDKYDPDSVVHPSPSCGCLRQEVGLLWACHRPRLSPGRILCDGTDSHPS
jgi:hypothetical protein